MAKASQNSIVNAKGKYLQDGEEAKFGGEKGAAIFSGRAAAEKKSEMAEKVEGLKVVAAPQAALDRLAKMKEKADKAAAKASKAPKAPKTATVKA